MWYKLAFLCVATAIIGIISGYAYKKTRRTKKDEYFGKILENINRYDGTTNGQKEVL